MKSPRFRSSGIYKVGFCLRDFEISNSQDSFLAAFYAGPPAELMKLLIFLLPDPLFASPRSSRSLF